MQTIQDPNNENIGNDTILAAIDLGSNSFHMVVAKIEHGELRPIEERGEKIQLARGLNKGALSQESIERGLACLRRFQQVLDSLQPTHIRVVGTNTLRAATNAKVFNKAAEAILGRPIEIVAGREEARLVYLGVSHTLADDDKSRLVVDIGGGSTEFIIGQQFEATQCESLHMGCVAYTTKFFGDNISESCFKKAYNAARLELLHIKPAYDDKWQECIGSSGTFKALALISQENGWTDEGISPKSLQHIKKALLKANEPEGIKLLGLKENRRGVITAGCAITMAIFDTLNIEHMRFSPGALREGVIYDALGRFNHEDVRERTVSALISRHGINTPNIETILVRCKHFFDAVSKKWALSKSDLQYLLWAARLHEIGFAIAHTKYHRHGHYLLDNADLPGFSRREQHLLAMLVRCHRRKLPKLEFQQETEADRQKLLYLSALLRLALCFKYSEQVESLPQLKIDVYEQGIRLHLPENWLEQHPITAEELALEQYRLGQMDLVLDIDSTRE